MIEDNEPVERGTTISIRFLPEGKPGTDPIPWSYWATDDNGDLIPEAGGWAGTQTEAVEYCVEKLRQRETAGDA